MTQLTCGHSPDMTTSMITDSDEELSVGICNDCYIIHKLNFDKFGFKVTLI